ncbi:hypothetical protein GGF43_002520 [Coemansia sp. RSA 2618]|nr:hypothetical protein GGF43_002520 [Coemansia sp. RSA 2618]
MLRRLAINTLRTGTVQRSSVRLYSSDSGASDAPPPPKSESSKESSSQDSLKLLIDRFASQESRQAAGASPAPAARTPRYSDMLGRGSNNSMMKEDFMGFNRSGRYGSVINSQYNQDEDPMSKLILHVHASSNNTILSLTDLNGRVIVNSSGGLVGFKKAQRAGFEAAYQATASIANTVKEKGIVVRRVEIRLRGFGAGRDAAFKAVNSLTNWNVSAVSDVTPIPFNGCRPKKARRL